MKVLNRHIDKNIDWGTSVYVGRGSKYGNPFVIGKHGTRKEVIAKYIELMFLKHPDRLAQAAEELRGKNLVCYCAPAQCHADFLMQIANAKKRN